MIRRLYHILALIAIINLFAVAGLAGYLFASGRLNEERVRQMAGVLRGEYPAAQVAATQPVEVKPQPQRSREEIAAIQAQREFYQLVSERHRREMVDRAELNDSIQLRVLQRLEEIEQKKKTFQQQKEAFEKQSEQEGFSEALDVYSSIDPKQAKELLQMKEKDADVVQLLMEMEPFRRKKIVNACKTPEDRAWIGRILNQIQAIH
jgi:flagellar motility protein MotE (MotC chaperone)